MDKVDYAQMSNKEFIENLRTISFQYAKISVENYRRRENKLFSEEELGEVRTIELDMEGAIKEFLYELDDPNR